MPGIEATAEASMAEWPRILVAGPALSEACGVGTYLFHLFTGCPAERLGSLTLDPAPVDWTRVCAALPRRKGRTAIPPRARLGQSASAVGLGDRPRTESRRDAAGRLPAGEGRPIRRPPHPLGAVRHQRNADVRAGVGAAPRLAQDVEAGDHLRPLLQHHHRQAPLAAPRNPWHSAGNPCHGRLGPKPLRHWAAERGEPHGAGAAWTANWWPGPTRPSASARR